MRKIILLSFGLLILLAACENDVSKMNRAEEVSLASDEAMPLIKSELNTPPPPSDRKIIWRGELEMEVSNVDQATQEINEMALLNDAFVSNMELSSNNYEITNRITLRVNSQKFNPLLNSIKGKGTYVRKFEVNSNDVTEQFIDIESRLKTKKEVRERYIQILKNKTGEISDVIEAEEAIRKITEEIEAKEGRLRYLQDKVNLSTIEILIYEKVEYQAERPSYEKSFGDKALEGLQNGWSIITAITIFLINLWPLVLAIGILIWRRKWLVRKFKRKE